MLNAIPITWYSFDTSEISDPSGERHINGGAFAFEKVVGSGVCVSGLQFPEIEADLTNPQDNYTSRPVALIFRLDDISVGSGINSFRFFLYKDSALKGEGIMPDAFVQVNTSGIWQPNCTMPSGAGTRLTLGDEPSFANVLRQDGKNWIDSTSDSDVSQYIYINVVVPSIYPIGDFGICGSGELSFGLKYDYAEIT